MRRSPFSIFRENNKVLMVLLTGFAMFAFIVADAFTNQQGGLAQIMPYLMGMIAGGLLFWLFGSASGKGGIYASVGVLVGLLVVVLLPNLFGPQAAVSSTVGNLSENELNRKIQERHLANRFLVALAEQVYGSFPGIEQQVAGVAFGPLSGLTAAEERREAALQFVMAQSADELGVRVSDEGVANYLTSAMGKEEIREAFIDARQVLQISEEELFDILRYHIKVRQFIQLAVPELATTPAERWDYYRRMTISQTLTVAAVPVEPFAKQASEPSEAELSALFEEFKSSFPQYYLDPDLGYVRPVETLSPQPEFGLPRRVKLAYLEAKFADFETEPEAVTDEEIKTYYEEHLSQYRNPHHASRIAERQADFDGAAVAERAPGRGAPGGPAVAEAPPYQSLAEVRDRVRASLEDRNEQRATIAAVREIHKTLETAVKFMNGLQRERFAALDKQTEEPAAAADPGQIAAKLKEFAQQNRLTYHELPLLAPGELGDSQKHPIAVAVAPRVDERDSFVEGIDKQLSVTRRENVPVAISRVYQDAPTRLYVPYEGVDSELQTQSFPILPVPYLERTVKTDGNRYVYWKVADEESRVPEFAEVREAVEAAWRRQKSRDDARKRAETLAELVKSKPDQPFQEVVANESVVPGTETPKVQVEATGSFTWMQIPPSRMSEVFEALQRRQPPPLRAPVTHEIPAVPKAGPKFMETVFRDLGPGEVGVAPNGDESVYYAVKVDSRSHTQPADREALRQAFLTQRQDTPPEQAQMQGMAYIANSQQRELMGRWIREFEEQHNILVTVPANAEQ